MTSDDGSATSLQQRIDGAGGPIEMLRGPGQVGPYAFPGIPYEFTNWRDEQRAWHNGVALLEQSYHMAELALRGPEVIPFLKQFAVNRFDPFPVRKAKQVVVTSPDGYLIGDAILFHEETEFFRVVGESFTHDWLLFQLQDTDLEVTGELNPSWSVIEAPRDVFRFQIQGRHALDLMRDVIDGEVPDVPFFSVADISVTGIASRALRHGMGGQPGFEIYGPWDSQDAVRSAVEEAGQKYGLRKTGAVAYATPAQESGWMPLPLPAIYHGEALQPYREWSSAHSLGSIGSLGGSLVCPRIEDYYVDPIEAGYGRLIDWDNEFLGHDALAERAENPQRTKVTLVWNDDDVAAVNYSALFDADHAAQIIAMPSPMYSTWAADAVQSCGETIGFSQYMAYSANARHVLSHGILAKELAEPGTELTLLWGEPDSRREIVDGKELREIRVTVAQTPYFSKVIKSDEA